MRAALKKYYAERDQQREVGRRKEIVAVESAHGCVNAMSLARIQPGAVAGTDVHKIFVVFEHNELHAVRGLKQFGRLFHRAK